MIEFSRPLVGKVVKLDQRRIRRYMTLIAAVRSSECVAIAADAVETVGGYRRAVQKIQPRRFGRLDILIAGSGNADLIDSFVIRLERVLPTANISNLQDFVSSVENELADFHAVDVAVCPDEPQEKIFRLLIAASNGDEFDVWVSKNIQLERIAAYTLVGWDATLYHGVIQKLVSPLISVQQAILAALYTLIVAKETSNYVGGDISMSVVFQKSIWPESVEYVKEMEVRLKAYERELNQMFLACADTSLTTDQLSQRLKRFGEYASGLHSAHIEQVINSIIAAGQKKQEFPYNKFPLDVRYYSTRLDDLILDEPDVKE